MLTFSPLFPAILDNDAPEMQGVLLVELSGPNDKSLNIVNGSRLLASLGGVEGIARLMCPAIAIKRSEIIVKNLL